MKKKLKLNVEELRIDQFHVQPASVAARGTVRGHETASTCWASMGSNSDPCDCPYMPITFSCEGTECW